MTKLFYAFVFPITTAITPPIIAADTASKAIGIAKFEFSVTVAEACIKKFMLSAHNSPIRNPALRPVLNVLICAQRLKIKANVNA